jgi:hypothetical protein
MKEFIVKPGKSGRKLFCSLPCFHKWNTIDKVPVACKNCGKTEYFQPAQAKHRTNCSKKCKYEKLAKENSINFIGKRVKALHEKSQKKVYREVALANQEAKCLCCGRSNIRFDVHHKDGNRLNNTWDNLIIVCGSCHRRIHKASEKYKLTLEQALEVVQITGHLPKVRNYLRLPGVVEEIELAVAKVLASSA